MRIISKFKDYYDAGLAYGRDEALVFVREQKTFERQEQWNKPRRDDAPEEYADFIAWVEPRLPRGGDQWLTVASERKLITWEYGVILFAGKLHPFGRVACISGLEKPQRYAYSLDDWNAASAEYGLEPFKNQQSLAEFFKLAGSDALLEKAFAHRWQILELGPRWRSGTPLTVNPCLKDREFFRCMEVWKAYQELSMYLGNLAAPDRVPVHIEDKYRIAQHGFDRMSFRKPPQE